jgi:hypothetical protein
VDMESTKIDFTLVEARDEEIAAGEKKAGGKHKAGARETPKKKSRVW